MGKPTAVEVTAELRRYGQRFRGNPYLYGIILLSLFIPSSCGIALLRATPGQPAHVIIALALSAILLFLTSAALIAGLLWWGAIARTPTPRDKGKHFRRGTSD